MKKYIKYILIAFIFFNVCIINNKVYAIGKVVDSYKEKNEHTIKKGW